jgi:hypothetical protein
VKDVDMYCTNCGTALTGGDSYCGNCGASVVPSTPRSQGSTVHAPQPVASQARQPSPRVGSELIGTVRILSNDEQQDGESSPSTPSDRKFKLGAVGFVLGGLLGFVLRPSVFLIGQLPLGTVLTRGGNLQGMDELLVPAAQSSFNLMVVVALVGAAIGVGVAAFLDKQSASSRRRPL